MLTENVSPEFAAQIESAEVNAWLDMYAAIPNDFAHQFGLAISQVQNVVLTHSKLIPFVHFNCVKNLGMNTPANEVEKVTRATSTQWAGYIDAIYGLPTTPWLLALVDRPGWHHYMLRNGAQIVAVRTLYIHPNGMAWLGIDAPVPGIMAPSFDLDRQLCQAIVQDGLALGVRYFVADIEAPSPQMDTPAYRNFEEL